MLIETFEERCFPSLYSLKEKLLNFMVDDVQIFRTLYVLDRSPREHFIVHIKPAYKITLQSKVIEMMKTVRAMKRGYEKAWTYRKEVGEGGLRQCDEILARIVKRCSHAVRNGISISLEEIAQAADVRMRRSSTASFVSELVILFDVSTVKVFLGIVRQIAAKWVKTFRIRSGVECL